MDNKNQNTECCPAFDPTLWDGKAFEWENKKFVRAKVFSFFYMPINFGSVIMKLDKKIREAGKVMQDWMCLSDHTSKWNMDIYLAVDGEISGVENVTLSGNFFSRVYEGNFQETGKWCKDFETDAKSRNLNIKKLYMWYTTCPNCAKKYGKNYVVIVGKVE
jgi:hypothetical protein